MNDLPLKVASAAMSIPEETLRRWAKVEGVTAPSLDLKRFAEIKARDAMHEAGHAVAAWRCTPRSNSFNYDMGPEISAEFAASGLTMIGLLRKLFTTPELRRNVH